MGKFLDRLKSALGGDGREWVAFLLALVLAFSIWTIHNLSLAYSEYLSVPVVAECNIEGHADVSSTQTEITAKCRARGFSILSSRLSARRHPTVVEFERGSMQKLNDEVYYVTSREMMEYTRMIFPENVNVDYFVTDTAFFRFPVVNSRKVPVSIKTDLDLKPQYSLLSVPKVEPDSVLIYGEPSYVGSIEEISTQIVRYSSLSTSKQGFVKLIVPANVRLSDESVKYSIPVTRYVTKTAEVTVLSRNVPYGKNFVVIPSKVKISINCVFPLLSDPFDGVTFYVDYKDFQHSRSGSCVLKASSLPDNVISWDSQPRVFDCVENDAI